MTEITYLAQQIEMPEFNQSAVNEWIEQVARNHNRVVGPLTYIFCSDEKILEVNRQFLQHDYFTDVITFDYSSHKRISGDIFISLDTVRSNAELFQRAYNEEFMRVVIHGVLHLCGINDKGPGEREIMEAHENAALALLPENVF
ncbi:MAG: rRNA maturation RNase YbeY [Bacteroidales bacterium]|nr:rRNA maturation RNase YbeY [Bacteroidales bacterium]